MTTIRMGQYGTKHGHAAGKLAAMLSNPAVEVAGVYEPDLDRRRELAHTEGPFGRVRWFDAPGEMLEDPSIVAIASEGRNDESLAQTAEIIRSGKHVWYDKPAGENWAEWQRVVAEARECELLIQMGYMFRYHEGFRRIAEWARSGFLGRVFSVRAHMSTHIAPQARRIISVHRGGIWFDLAGHMLDQIVWVLGRPDGVTSFLRHDDDPVPGFADNTLVVLEYPHAMAMVGIAAMEASPMARRFEVYGSRGSAILLEPFEPARTIRLCLDEPRDGYGRGVQMVPITPQSRQSLYELELAAFLRALSGQLAPDRPLEHELLVQETLLRGTGLLSGR